MAGYSGQTCLRMLANRLRVFASDARMWIAIAYAAAIAMGAAYAYQRQAMDADATFNVFEPLVSAFSNPPFILLALGGVFVALCDIANVSSSAQYMLLRCSRAQWWTAELLFSAIVVTGFYAVIAAVSVLLVIANSYLKDVWSPLARSIAYGTNTSRLSLFAVEYYSPSGAAAVSLCLQILHALTLVQMSATVNIAASKSKGAAVAIVVEIVSYCMYLFGVKWFTPVSVYVHSLLEWQGAYAVRLGRSVMFYAIAIGAAIVAQRLLLKRFYIMNRRNE